MVFFGEWLAKRRAELGLTMRDVAEIADVSAARVSAWERGIEEPPYEFRDACWDALKRDGEIPPLDPPPFLTGAHRAPAAGADATNTAHARHRSTARTWIEEMAESRGTTLEDVLKAFGLSVSLKYQWRAGKHPGRDTQWKILSFLEIPAEVARANGWDPDVASESD
jgi:transcriptional regulator with XRE-family HTH domain